MGTVTVGRVLAAHGVTGGCKCAYHTDYPERLQERRDYILRDSFSNEILLLSLKSLRLLESSFLISFSEIAQREQMMRLGGWLLEVASQHVPADKQEDEFYFYELEGLEVISATGNVLGTVKNVVQGTGEEILEIIVPGEDTRLIPFAKIAIQGIDLKARCIILQPDFEF